MDENAAKQFLGIGAGTNAPTNALAPRTSEALSAMPQPGLVASGLIPAELSTTERAAFGGMTRATFGREKFIAENVEPGVPLDIKTGVSGWERLMLDARINRQNQIKYLENKYGPGTVRESTEGDLIVRVPDSSTGKSKDVLVKPKGGLSLDDFMGIATALPEVGGWIWAERASKALPLVGKAKGVVGGVRGILSGAAGAEAAGTIKDVAFNVYDRGVVDLPSTLKERGKMAGVDVAIGAITKPVATFFQWLKNPLHHYRGQTQFDAIEAQRYFKQKYGVEVPLSVGESTAAPLFARTEVFIEKLPGGSGPIREIKTKQETAFRKLQSILMGDPGTDEEFGQKAISEIQKSIEPTTAAVETMSGRLAAASQAGIEGIVAKTTLPAREVYKTALGDSIRSTVIGKRNAVQAEADRLFGIVKSLPGGEGKVFSGEGLQNDFKNILKSLPAPEQTVTKPTSLVDRFGNEIKQTSKEIKTLREFVPPNILARLESVAGLKGAKFSLSDLQQMRREVYDDIAKGEGVPGLGTHYLDDIGKAITKAIDEGVTSLPSGDLKAALQAANTHYKEKVIPFNRQGLTELFRTADEVGHVSDSEIVGRLLGGEKSTRNWQLMKETLGETSVEFNRLRRSVADNILENSRLPGEELIDAKSFSRNLANFFNKNREIADDVFKGTEGSLFKEARFLSYAQGDKIGAKDLQKLLNDPSPSAFKLQELVRAERNKDELYRNQLVKAIGSGELTEQTLKPTEFVNRVLETAGPKDVQAVVDMIGKKPELLQDLRQKTFQKVFRDGARQATSEDVNRIMSGETTHILSGVKIADALKSPTYAQKIKTILGQEGWDDLQSYIKLQTAPEARELSFKAAGGLAAGAQIARLERQGPFAYLTDAMRNFVFATILSRPPLRTWLTRIPEEPGKWSLILSSPPFLEAVVKEFGEGTAAESSMNTIKRAIDQTFTAKPSEPRREIPSGLLPPNESKQRWMQFLQSGKTNTPAMR